MRERDTTPVSEVLRLTGPAVLTSLLQTLVFLADRVMLGRHGAVSLGSLQISSIVMWSVFSLFFGAMIGVVALVARRVGAGERARARAVARVGLRLAGGIGVLVGVTGYACAGSIAELMGPPSTDPQAGAILDAATAYMQVGFCAFPPLFVASAGALVINSAGDTRTTFRIGALTNAVNFGANYLLIYGSPGLGVPELGAQGAALGTAVAYTLQAVLTLFVMRSPDSVLPIGGEPLAPAERAVVRREILRLSGPAFVERLVIHFGYLSFSTVVTGLGALAMAGHQALLTLESICFLGAEGFGVAAATVVGQFLGAGDVRGSARGGWFAAGSCALALSTCGVIIWLSGPWTLPLFVAPWESGAGLIAAAGSALPLLALSQPVMATAVVLGHALRGAGDTRSPVLAAFVGGLVIRVAGAWLLAHTWGLGLRGIWLATAIDWTVRTLIMAAVFWRGRWSRALGSD